MATCTSRFRTFYMQAQKYTSGRGAGSPPWPFWSSYPIKKNPRSGRSIPTVFTLHAEVPHREPRLHLRRHRRLRGPHQIKWIRLRVCLFAIDFYLQATLSPLDSISLVLHARNPYEPRPTSYSLALPSTDWASLGIASDKETCPICV